MLRVKREGEKRDTIGAERSERAYARPPTSARNGRIVLTLRSWISVFYDRCITKVNPKSGKLASYWIGACLYESTVMNYTSSFERLGMTLYHVSMKLASFYESVT